MTLFGNPDFWANFWSNALSEILFGVVFAAVFTLLFNRILSRRNVADLHLIAAPPVENRGPRLPLHNSMTGESLSGFTDFV